MDLEEFKKVLDENKINYYDYDGNNYRYGEYIGICVNNRKIQLVYIHINNGFYDIYVFIRGENYGTSTRYANINDVVNVLHNLILPNGYNIKRLF